jgi:hypothetical protein
VTFWQKRVQAEPTGAIALRELAGAYLARARETGDISYAVKAEQAARKSLQVLPERITSLHSFVWLVVCSPNIASRKLWPLPTARLCKTGKLTGCAPILHWNSGNVPLAESALAAIPALPDDPKRQNDLNYKALRARLLEGKGQWREGLALRRKLHARQRNSWICRLKLPPGITPWWAIL